MPEKRQELHLTGVKSREELNAATEAESDEKFKQAARENWKNSRFKTHFSLTKRKEIKF